MPKVTVHSRTSSPIKVTAGSSQKELTKGRSSEYDIPILINVLPKWTKNDPGTGANYCD